MDVCGDACVGKTTRPGRVASRQQIRPATLCRFGSWRADTYTRRQVRAQGARASHGGTFHRLRSHHGPASWILEIYRTRGSIPGPWRNPATTRSVGRSVGASWDGMARVYRQAESRPRQLAMRPGRRTDVTASVFSVQLRLTFNPHPKGAERAGERQVRWSGVSHWIDSSPSAPK